MNPSFQETVRDICKKDARYHPDAYEFLVEALDVTVKKLNKCQSDHPRHVTGQELLEGIKEFALNAFGPLAFTVFSEWGIHTTEDFGEIVFNLVDAGRLRSTEGQVLGAINAANLRQAHALVESGKAKGKVVLAGWA